VAVTVARLCHYPVKGLAGRELERVSLSVGEGLPYDRAVALTNGTARWTGSGSRPPVTSLLAQARNPGLTRLRVDVDDEHGLSVTVTAPDDSSFHIDLESASNPQLEARRQAQLRDASACLAGWIPAASWPPQVVMTDPPYWEQPDGALSLVGLATVEQLGRAWSTTVDPARFRANVYLSGLQPGEELELVGRTVRVGTAELDILRPIERRAGASVDPVTGSTDLDVAGLLDADVGHRCVGVYARVSRPGHVLRGDQLIELPAPRTMRRTVIDSTRGWPRPLQVDAVLPEPPPRTAQAATPVVHLWVRDPLGLVPSIDPGQHVRLHAVDGAGPFWRSYTVSGVHGDLCRLSVALEPDGRMAQYLGTHCRDELALSVTGPFGEPTPAVPASSGLLLLSAGIGITPTVALLRHLVSHGCRQPVRVLHVERHWPPPLWGELCELLERLPASDGPAALHLTRESSATAHSVGARHGRPTADDLATAVGAVPGDPVVLVCGSGAFSADMRSALLANGVPSSAVRQEVFYSPPPARRPRQDPVDPGPFAVRFAATGTDSTWTTSSGSLLDVAESTGLTPPVDCRTGACNVCATQLVAGTTAYTTPPMVPPPDGTVLICCAVPTSDVTLTL
jgi:ferredoxin-NADP reductase/uncharacterized protein YcbX